MAGRRPDDPEPHAAPTPRRVKHLILLPGGGEPQAAPVEEDPWAPEPGRSTGSRGSVPRLRRRRPRQEPPAPPERAGPEPPDGADRASGPGPTARMQAAAGGSAQAALDALPLELPAPSSFKLKLSVISRSVASSRRPGMPFIVFASSVVGLTVLGLVILHVMVDQASFRMNSLDAQVTRQQAQLRQLNYEVSLRAAPSRVASEALNLGLVPANQLQTLVGGGALPTSTVTAPLGKPPGTSSGERMPDNQTKPPTGSGGTGSGSGRR